MPYRLRITLAGYGNDEDAAESLLDCFAQAHPDLGPVVSQDTAANTLSVVFSLEADDPNDALERAKPIFVDCATTSTLEPVEVIELNASLIASERSQERAREMQPA